MKKQIHLLNGDALSHQLEGIVVGEKIVCRECLVEGSIHGDSLEEFFGNRAKYLFNTYQSPIPSYEKRSKREFEKLRMIGSGAELNLWFEDDLFCQCNFWFSCHLLATWKISNPVYLFRPAKHHEYSFGSMPQAELKACLQNRIKIEPDHLHLLQKLWLAYRDNNTTEMIALAQKLHSNMPFIGPAVYANISNRLGIPEKSLKQIMDELQTREFAPVFNAFCKQEPIYGFGDSQVKRMFHKIIAQIDEQ